MKKQYIIQILLALALVVIVNILSSFWYGRIDMTEEQRFTMTEPTKELIRNFEDNLLIRVYLKGEFPAGFKRLQNSTEELLAQMRALNPNIEYEFSNPNAGTQKEINAFRKKMSDRGVYPVEFEFVDNDKKVQKQIYPYAEINYDDRSQYVNLLEPQEAGQNQEVVLNNSVNLLEYKLAKAIQNSVFNVEPIVMFTQGQGELPSSRVESVRNGLEKFYRTGTINLDSTYYINDKVDLLIVAKPRKSFTEKKKFMIDQFVMNGGKVIWMIDKLNITLDSMRRSGSYVPQAINLNLEDLFFKYGFRLNDDVILDLNCSKIPLTSGRQGNKPQIQLYDWYYHPVIVPSGKSEITKALNLINLKSPGTFDTVKTELNVKKTPLLFTSEYSRVQRLPFSMNFEMLRYDPKPSLFNNGPYPTALLLEGQFSSLYKNRVSQNMMQGLNELDIEYKSSSVPTRMLVVTDGDMIQNEVNPRTNEYREAGYNQFNQVLYANKQFLLNSAEYLLNPDGIFQARNRDIKLRLLNTVKAEEEKTYWQVLNIGTPLFILIIFGILFNFLRKQKYSTKYKS